MQKTLIAIAAVAVFGFGASAAATADCSKQQASGHACCKKVAAASMSAEKSTDCCATADMCSNMDKARMEKISEAMKAAQEMQLTGKVLCAACDLKSAEKCEHVFKTDDATYTLAGGSACMDMCKTAAHGAKTVTAKVKMATVDGKPYVQVLSFEVATEKPV